MLRDHTPRCGPAQTKEAIQTGCRVPHDSSLPPNEGSA